MEEFKLRVPVKTHIRKYFTGIYGDPLPITRNTKLGDVILTKLTASPIKKYDRQSVEMNIHKFPTFINISFPVDLFYRIRIHEITEEQYYSVARYLEKVFFTDFVNMVQIGTFYGLSRIDCIKEFLVYHDISELDIQAQSLKQRYYREVVKKPEQQSFLSHLRKIAIKT